MGLAGRVGSLVYGVLVGGANARKSHIRLPGTPLGRVLVLYHLGALGGEGWASFFQPLTS